MLETQEHRLGLARLLVVPCLGLVWPGPVSPALPTLPWPGPATTTGRLRRPAAAAPSLSGTITIPYKFLIYTGHFWAPAAPGALWAALAGLAWVVLPGRLAGWSGWLIWLIWLAG